MKKILCLATLFIAIFLHQPLYSQSVTILPGEVSDYSQLNYTKVFIGNGKDDGGSDNLCYFNKSKGMITLGFELQSNQIASWPESRIAIWYNGEWHQLFEIWWKESPATAGAGNYPSWDVNRWAENGYYPTYLGGDVTQIASFTTGNQSGSSANGNVYLKNLGKLRRYDGNYLPLSGDIINRTQVSHYNNFTIQTDHYAPPFYNYPVRDPANNTGVQAVPIGWSANHAGQYTGNLPGVGSFRESEAQGIFYINLVNLPPDMLESGNFRVHLFQNANTAHDRIYEWVYNNENFMVNAPMSLTATKDQCNKVSLSWSNANNPLPNDGGTMQVKTVVFRNGDYLAMVDGGVTSYVDNTAALGVSYQYSLRHVAFSSSGKTYFRSPFSATVQGQSKPAPDQPISPTASTTTCNGVVNVGWSYNGVNPSNFRIDFSTSPTGVFTTLATVAGAVRSYSHNTTRGQVNYYRIYAINDCGTISEDYAETSGFSIANPAVATNITATVNTSSDTITVRWTDVANNETKYQLQRTDDLGSVVTYDINPTEGSGTTMTFKDSGITSCRSYTYSVKVFNECIQSGLVSSSVNTGTIPPPNLTNAFSPTKKLVASKGYFSNRVELSWQYNYGNSIDQFKIFRKIYGVSGDSSAITTIPAGNTFFVDNTADARVYYKYTIVGIKNCNNQEILTNVSEDIGFRNPTGLINGHIEYNGGISLHGAKVLVQQTGGASGNALKFTPGATLQMQESSTLNINDQLRVEFWLKPTSDALSQTIVQKNNTFGFEYDKGSDRYAAKVHVNGSDRTLFVNKSNFPLNTWKHVSMQYNGQHLIVYADGVKIDSLAAAGTITPVSSRIIIGGSNANFLIDEFRVLNKTVSNATIGVDHGRFINYNTSGMVALLHFDEAFGRFAFDVSSQNNVYNANHFEAGASAPTWSNDIPTSNQLRYFGITDELGNYSVSGITYSGSGESFTVIPSYLTHSFTPNSRSIYIGDASNVFNNQDFIDNSSFTVTGQVWYGDVVDSNLNGVIDQDEIVTYCPVPDAFLKIDGNAVLQDGVQVKTDANGLFSIQVPIGLHHLEVEIYGHTMAIGRFPASGKYDFQDDLAGIQFVDSTKRIIIGRVVGGLVEANKAPGMGRSINNIGQARIKIVSPMTGVACFEGEAITDAETGEYRFAVPPLQYRIESVALINAPFQLNETNTSNTNVLLDLRNIPTMSVARDTVYNDNGEVIRIDSVEYHKRHDMIYRVAPSMAVTSPDGGALIGERQVKFGSTNVSLLPTPSAPNGPVGYPVYQQGKTYSVKISAFEIYKNVDTNKPDSVRLGGKARVYNDLIDGSDPQPVVDIVNGSGTYTFLAGSPNTTIDQGAPQYNGTKTIQIDLTPTSAATIKWEPYGAGNGNLFRGYVLGARATGVSATTLGPEMVDYILRDPPGSGSSATWESGSTKVNSYKSGFIHSEGFNLKNLGMVGSKQVLGIGVGTVSDNFVALGLEVGYTHTFGDDTLVVETVRSNTTISTRDDEDNVGANADIFIGKSINWLDGLTLSIDWIDESACGSLTSGCFGDEIAGKRLAIIPGYASYPQQIATRFAYTQQEIETVVIPKLEEKRNSYLSGVNPDYTSHLPVTDYWFGSNNDDPHWNTSDPRVFDKRDTTGSSYTFRGYAAGKRDEVRYINNQISLWKRALAQNEKEKMEAIKRAEGYRLLDNFTLGNAIITNSYETESTRETTHTWEHHINEGLVMEAQVLFSNFGYKGENSVTFEQTVGGSRSESNTTTSSFSYTLTDGNPGDILSIDVYGTSKGNIFITRGGQTMCPYECEIVSHYYDPANPNAFISSHAYNPAGYGDPIQLATQQREIPKISVTPVSQEGIPSNQAAVFQLNLRNDAITDFPNDVQMRVFVASQSNPNGAIVKIDGLDPNTLYTIPKGASVTKTLTVERGPIEINYDSLMIVFASACSDDIADTVYISAHFIPTCTPISLTLPNDNWVYNNGTGKLANIVVSGYNYNYGAATDNSTNPARKLGFTKIGLEVRPTSTSTWTEFASFYKYPEDDQELIPSNQAYSQHLWDISGIPDGAYELKAKSYCLNKDGSYSVVESQVYKGVMDRINPEPFGTPSPGDGILDPNDDISIKFNEPVDIGALSTKNFDVRGVINGGNGRQSESLSFNGTNSYAEVPAVALQKRSFTFEFWAKLHTTNIQQTVISHGTDAAQHIAIGFDASNKLNFSIGAQSVASVNAVATPTEWHHYAVVYDYIQQTAYLYADGSLINAGNTILFSDYVGEGKLVFGKRLLGNTNYLNGSLNDMRLWNKARPIGDIVLTMNKDLTNTSSGLLYNWKLNEAYGTFSSDVIRSKDAVLYNTTWQITPGGYAGSFDGVDDRLILNSSTIAITKEMDFTLEFWFRSNQSGIATLFSNGKGDGVGSDSLTAWSIEKDAEGKIHVLHKGIDFVATDKNYFDNQWHHVALVMQRTSNLSCYVDGTLQKSVLARSFNELASSFMYIGARGYDVGGVTQFDKHFSGTIDEFRLWNVSRKVEQIKRDKQYRLKGDEYGLIAFVPFEHYAVDPTGIALLTPSFNEFSTDVNSVPENGVTVDGVASTQQGAALKVPRPVEAIAFTTSVNHDQIIITPTTAPALIENITLDITVKDVYDLRGNKMQSPKTWIAYVNKNQVLWQGSERSFTKKADEVLTFTTTIVNSGGASKDYHIGGLPTWLSTLSASGTLAPNSSKVLTFTIPAGSAVGQYDASLTLTTDFGYDEILHVSLTVKGDEPTWVVNPSNFEYSMNVFGEIKIDGVLSTNPSTKIAAFINGTLSGVILLTYQPMIVMKHF
jgi:hypothetical protein